MIRIREFVPQDSQADFDRLLPAYLELWNHPDNLPYLIYTLKPLEPKAVRFDFMHHLMLGNRYFAVMANDRIVALSVLQAAPAERFEILGMAVQPEFQGRGIGRKLIDNAAIIARWDGFPGIRATVFSDNRRMMTLLLRSGFQVSDVSEAARADGTDLVELCRDLGVTNGELLANG